MATTKLEPVLRPDGRWQCGFVTTCNRAVLQLNRNGADGGAAFLEASADGVTFAPLTPPILAPDITVPVNLPKGFTVRVTSSSPITYACVIADTAAEIPVDPTQMYYPNAVQDYDGNWYDAVIIGNQVWTAENLRSKHYADGTSIPFGGTGAGTEINPYSVLSNTDPYYYYPKGNAQNVNKYGILYNWPAVTNADGSSEKDDIAPDGFHVMTMTEFAQLIQYLSSQQRYWSDGETSTYIMKAIAADHDWPESSVQYAIGNDLTKNNASGFSLLPATCINVLYFGEGTELWAKDAGGYENTGTAYTFNKDRYQLKTSNVIARTSSVGSSVRCVCDMAPDAFRSWYVRTYNTNNHQVDNKYATD